MSVSAALINLAIVVLLSPLVEGILRKLRAVAHSRQGPPLWQPYLDILKLLVKEDMVVSRDPFFRLAPYLAVAGTLTLALMVPMGAGVPFDRISDIDINPFFVYEKGKGGVAVDVKILLKPSK